MDDGRNITVSSDISASLFRDTGLWKGLYRLTLEVETLLMYGYVKIGSRIKR